MWVMTIQLSILSCMTKERYQELQVQESEVFGCSGSKAGVWEDQVLREKFTRQCLRGDNSQDTMEGVGNVRPTQPLQYQHQVKQVVRSGCKYDGITGSGVGQPSSVVLCRQALARHHWGEQAKDPQLFLLLCIVQAADCIRYTPRLCCTGNWSQHLAPCTPKAGPHTPPVLSADTHRPASA